MLPTPSSKSRMWIETAVETALREEVDDRVELLFGCSIFCHRGLANRRDCQAHRPQPRACGSTCRSGRNSLQGSPSHLLSGGDLFPLPGISHGGISSRIQKFTGACGGPFCMTDSANQPLGLYGL